jgi:hypothetical protein
VLAVADLTGVRATGTVRLFADGALQDSNDFAYLALAEYGEPGCYVFYCDRQWEVQNDMLYDSRNDAEQMVAREFEGVRFVDV